MGGVGRLTGALAAMWRGALHLVSPDCCEVCGTPLVAGEDVICLGCLHAMPLTRCAGTDNALHHRLASTQVTVERAAAMFHYVRNDPYSRLIHFAKYDGRPRIVRVLARIYGHRLVQQGYFDGVDLLLPVPLAPLKQLRRGYNQSLWIARGLSEACGVPVGDHLRTGRSHSTQTRRSRYQRWTNLGNDPYRVVRPHELEGRHVMVVDDVLTTGATLQACALAVHRAAPGATISVVTLAAP